jgi:aspartyl protease family protein
MSDGDGPWGRGGPWHVGRRGRVAIWLALVAGVGIGAWALSRAFPGQTGSGWVFVLRDVGFVALISSGILTAARFDVKEKVRHGAVWVGIVAVLVLGYAYRGELGDVALRVRQEFAPGGVSTAPHELVLSQGENGGFFVMGRVNGQPVRFMVDTGASDIVLDPADAQRVGVDLAAARFDRAYGTANGVGAGAPFTARSLTVGDIRLADVAMSVNQAPMGTSLLGMTFLKRLESFEVRGTKLHMKWRG